MTKYIAVPQPAWSGGPIEVSFDKVEVPDIVGITTVHDDIKYDITSFILKYFYNGRNYQVRVAIPNKYQAKFDVYTELLHGFTNRILSAHHFSDYANQTIMEDISVFIDECKVKEESPFVSVWYMERLARELPGMNEVAQCPVCLNSDTLFINIQHINDKHKWPREAIADWLDSLADEGKINIDFSPWEE